MAETVKGIVKALKKDKKGLQLENGKWYSNQFAAEVDCQKGDEVEVKYTVNGNFNNYTEVKVLKKAESGKASGKSYDPSTMLVSYAKDISIESMKIDRAIAIDDAVDLVLKAYFKVQSALSDPVGYMESKVTPEEK